MNNQPNHTRFIVGCISVLSLMFGIIGGMLVFKGFQGGEIFATMGGQGLAGLVGFLGGKMMANSPAGTTDDPVKTKVTNTASNPVQVEETK